MEILKELDFCFPLFPIYLIKLVYDYYSYDSAEILEELTYKKKLRKNINRVNIKDDKMYICKDTYRGENVIIYDIKEYKWITEKNKNKINSNKKEKNIFEKFEDKKIDKNIYYVKNDIIYSYPNDIPLITPKLKYIKDFIIYDNKIYFNNHFDKIIYVYDGKLIKIFYEFKKTKNKRYENHIRYYIYNNEMYIYDDHIYIYDINTKEIKREINLKGPYNKLMVNDKYIYLINYEYFYCINKNDLGEIYKINLREKKFMS
jgi:hypothetical protein